MRSSDIATVVGALTVSAPPRITEGWRQDCCIAATRMGIEVLRHFGVQARPRVCEALIINRTSFAAACAGKTGQELHPSNLPGGWGIGIGIKGAVPGVSWNGHMIAEVEDVCLIDLTLGQASRPQHDLPLPPAAWFKWPLGWPTSGAAIDLPEGGLLTYSARVGDKSYVSAPDWTKTARQRPTVAAIIRDMKEVLK